MSQSSEQAPRSTGNAAQADSDLSYLLAGARRGCDRSLGDLTERYRRYLLLVAHQEISAALRAKVSPSDLVQETFLHAGQSFARFTGSSEEELLAWLRRILHYRALRAARHFHQSASRSINREDSISQRLAGAVAVAARDLTPCAQVQANEAQLALQSALAGVSEENRRILLLRTLERKSFVEIGTLVGCTAEAARKRWARAVAQLRLRWKRDD